MSKYVYEVELESDMDFMSLALALYNAGFTELVSLRTIGQSMGSDMATSDWTPGDVQAAPEQPSKFVADPETEHKATFSEDDEEPEQEEEQPDLDLGGYEDNDVDSAGVKYDPAIHSSSKKKNKDGIWRMRKGVKSKETSSSSQKSEQETGTSSDSGDFEQPEEQVTKDDVRSALSGLHDDYGMDTCVRVLQRFGATSVSSVDESQYAEVLKVIERVKNGGEV